MFIFKVMHEFLEAFRREKSAWNVFVSGTREFWNLRFKTNWTRATDCVKKISSPRIERFCVKLPILTLSVEALCILISHGTSWIAEIIHWIISPNVRTHLRKVSKMTLSSIKDPRYYEDLLFTISFSIRRLPSWLPWESYCRDPNFSILWSLYFLSLPQRGTFVQQPAKTLPF